MLHFDLHYGRTCRTFVELRAVSILTGSAATADRRKEARLSSRFSGARPLRRVQIRSVCGRRQELEYGSGDNRRSRKAPMFGSASTALCQKPGSTGGKVDGFAVRPDSTTQVSLTTHRITLLVFGACTLSRPLPHKNSLEAYYLGLDRKEKKRIFQRGTAQEVRHNLGARFSRPIATEQPGWDFDYEGLWQFARSVRRTLRPGPSPPKQAIASQPFL